MRTPGLWLKLLLAVASALLGLGLVELGLRWYFGAGQIKTEAELQRRREEYGFSYVVFSGEQHDAMAPVVKRLAGK